MHPSSTACCTALVTPLSSATTYLRLAGLLRFAKWAISVGFGKSAVACPLDPAGAKLAFSGRPTTRTTASCASAASISPLHHVHVDVLWVIIAQECYMHITNESARRRSKRKSIFFKSTAIFVLSMKFSRV
jgi:hypothetical protein